MSADFAVEIVVLPKGLRFQAPQGSNLLELFIRHDLVVKTPCGGEGVCQKCVVWVGEVGGFEESGESSHFPIISALSFEDCKRRFHLRNALVCRTVVRHPMVVWVPDSGKTQIVTDHALPDDFDPNAEGTVRCQTVTMIPDVRSDVKTLEQCGVSKFSLEQIAEIPSRLRNAGWHGNLTAFQDQFIAFEAEDQPPVKFALAVDLGTTTLAVSLLDVVEKRSLAVASRHNPQSVYGDDIIARIQKSSESPDSQKRLQSVVQDAVNRMIDEVSREADIDRRQIAAVVIAGNTVMQQLFCGMDSTWLGFSPFVPSTTEYPVFRASELGIPIHKDGVAIFFPIIGGFVGGDIVSGILATQMTRQPGPSLLIDIGTNGEIVLWHNDRLNCAATAAGPAFEGARIRQGMIASQGAIERVAIDETVHLQTIGNVPATGICGSGLIDAASELLRLGIILPNGRFADPEKWRNPISNDLKKQDDLKKRMIFTDEGQRGFLLTAENPVVLTQHDIRQLQLAAGAIRCGVTLLLRQAGLEHRDLKTVYLAGGFGNYIRRQNAQRLGILPVGIPTDRILFCGNTSLAGAKMAIFRHNHYNQIQKITDQAKHVDLSAFPDFQTVFAESMIFP